MNAYLTFKKEKEWVNVKFIGSAGNTDFYKDTINGTVYPEDVLVFKEFYGD